MFPAITIGMAWLIVWMQTRYLRTGDEAYQKMARFWIKVFALSFAVGVATGITLEFQFGMNWARYSRFVGDIFGAPLVAEGLFAFFLESSFLGILLFGERRVSKKTYWFSGLMVAVGSTLSAFWIIVANSWQQTPAGFKMAGGRAELTDFWAAVFNPSTVPRYLHTVDGAMIAGAFFVLGLSAWFLLHGKHVDFAKRSLKMALVAGFISAVLQLPLGHFHAVQVAETQPAKLAAFEGLWETRTHAPLLVFGMPNTREERTDFALALPSFLSIFVGGSADSEVLGIKAFPQDERPPLYVTFFSFHLMFVLGLYFIVLTALGLLLWWRNQLLGNKLFLRMALFSMPLPVVANELGWIAAEVGRQPWIVQGLLRTDEAFSTVVSAGEIIFSIAVFSGIYTLLFFVWIFLLKRVLLRGPDEEMSTSGSGAHELAARQVPA